VGGRRGEQAGLHQRRADHRPPLQRPAEQEPGPGHRLHRRVARVAAELEAEERDARVGLIGPLAAPTDGLLRRDERCASATRIVCRRTYLQVRADLAEPAEPDDLPDGRQLALPGPLEHLRAPLGPCPGPGTAGFGC
jgi:hypothetical protein